MKALSLGTAKLTVVAFLRQKLKFILWGGLNYHLAQQCSVFVSFTCESVLSFGPPHGPFLPEMM